MMIVVVVERENKNNLSQIFNVKVRRIFILFTFKQIASPFSWYSTCLFTLDQITSYRLHKRTKSKQKKDAIEGWRGFINENNDAHCMFQVSKKKGFFNVQLLLLLLFYACVNRANNILMLQSIRHVIFIHYQGQMRLLTKQKINLISAFTWLPGRIQNHEKSITKQWRREKKKK